MFTFNETSSISCSCNFSEDDTRYKILKVSLIKLSIPLKVWDGKIRLKSLN